MPLCKSVPLSPSFAQGWCELTRDAAGLPQRGCAAGAAGERRGTIHRLQGLQRLTDGGRELGKMVRMGKMAKVKGLAMLKKGAFYRGF